MELTIRVCCTDLPGSTCADAADSALLARRRIHLGIQCGDVIANAVAGDRGHAVFEPVFWVRRTADGRPNFLGPYAKGTPDARFFSLSWAEATSDGVLALFGWLKVHLRHLTWEQVSAAVEGGRPVQVQIAMTDPKDTPTCGSVYPSGAVWSH